MLENGTSILIILALKCEISIFDMIFKKQELRIMKELAWADFKLKYSSSVLGFFWSLLNPLLMLTVLFLVFSVLMKWDIPNYQLYLLLGIIIWNYFAESTTKGMSSIVEKASLVKKIYFRREILVISACLTSLMTFFLNFIIFLVFMIIFKVDVSWHALYFPVTLIELFLLSIGISLALSAYYTKYRDLQHIWQVILQIGFFITPIIYLMETIPVQYQKIYMLNPIARIISNSRELFILHHIPGAMHLIITTLICLAIFVIGWAIFKKRKAYFAEEI